MSSSLPNGIAIILTAIALLLVPLTIAEIHTSECLATSGKESAERFLSSIAQNGEITITQYNTLSDMLASTGHVGTLTMTLYTYEIDKNGEQFQYITTWEEIREILEHSSVYYLPNRCYVKLTFSTTNNGLSSFINLFRRQSSFSKSVLIEKGGRL